MTAVLILPGLFGSGEGHWQQHWLRDHPDSRCVEQDDWDHPDLDAWTSKLEQALQEVGEAYIVAHSLGCVLAARLAGRESARRIRGALLVAPCDLSRTESLHPGRISFRAMPMLPLPFAAITVGSLNDHYMSLERLSLFGRAWKSEVKNIGNAGHINVASGFGRWVGGYRLLEGLKSRSPRRRPAPASAAAPALGAMLSDRHAKAAGEGGHGGGL